MKSLFISLTLRSEKGIVAVEFALFLPLFLMILFSIIEVGGAWNSKQMMVSASREGVRMASLFNDGNDITELEVQTYVLNILQQAGFPGEASVEANGINGSAGDLVTVSIESPYEFPVLTPLLEISPVNLTATTVVRQE